MTQPLSRRLATEQHVADETAGLVTTDDPRLSNARTPTTHTHGVDTITATGTKSATTYLRGDGTWSTPPAGTSSTVDTTKIEATVFHNGTTGGGTRPTGYARVRWVNPVGTTYARPTNMVTGDIWEHDQ